MTQPFKKPRGEGAIRNLRNFEQAIIKTRRTLKVDTQKTRAKLLKSLQEQFDIADEFAKDDSLTPKQRRFWMRISAYIGQVMNSLAKGFDESKISRQLDELERMILEGNGEKTEKTEAYMA